MRGPMSVAARRSVRAVAAAVATVALLAPAHAAADAPGTPTDADGRGLLLTVSGGRNTWSRYATLDCPAGTGTHPRGAVACHDLAQAGGDLDRLSGDRRLCTKEYDPVTATAQGTLGGTPVSWRKTFGNPCEMESATGPVFRF